MKRISDYSSFTWFLNKSFASSKSLHYCRNINHKRIILAFRSSLRRMMSEILAPFSAHSCNLMHTKNIIISSRANESIYLVQSLRKAKPNKTIESKVINSSIALKQKAFVTNSRIDIFSSHFPQSIVN